MSRSEVTVHVNGHAYTEWCEPRRTLADYLRHDCGLTGTHLGCEHGVCGACTVMVDGQTARACLTLAVQADGRDVTTIEGLSAGGLLNPLQQALSDHHGLQCGFCTPGIVMTLTEFLEEHPNADEAEIRECLAGNICRCTGYQFIVDAVLALVESQRTTPA